MAPMDTPGTIELTRDRWGIGHARAADPEAAFWAQGWLAASDRLWQMEWDRRRALGRWAEVAGPPAVGEDRFFRRLDLAAVARADHEALSPSATAMTEAYSRGVNAWLDANRSDLPPEFEHHRAPPDRWEPWHCLAVYKVRHIFMGTLHRKLWRGTVAVRAGSEALAALVGDPGTDTAMVPGSGPAIDLLEAAADTVARAATDLAAIPTADGGSNSWALDGSRTASGRPLLAGDPHRGIEFPNVYYQCHLTCPAFDVIGLAFPGVPGFPHFGHNASVAWCITHGMADDTDVFVEPGPALDRRTERIEVLASAPVTVDCRRTERGPIVLGDGGPDGDGPGLSLAWTGMWGTDTTFECLRPMLEATTVDELEESVRAWVIPVNNLLTADVAGTISFRLRGRIVERPAANRWTPVPADAAGAWAGKPIVAFDDLHRWRNPDRGYLVTANNRTGDDGPYVSVDFAGPARHDRIVELIEPLRSATVADMTAIHRDTRSPVARQLLPVLSSARPGTDRGREARDRLIGWDGDLGRESVAATVYAALRRWWAVEVGRRLGIGSPTLGEPGWPSAVSASRTLFDGASTLLADGTWSVVPGLDDAEGLATVLGAGLDEVAAELTERLGPDLDSWHWERSHVMVSPHPLAAARPALADLHPPVDGCPGDGDTVRAASVMPLTGDRVAASSVARYVFDLADWDRSGWVVPHGVSGRRGGGHDLDQRATWLAGELLPMAYSPAAVAEVAVTVESLTTGEETVERELD